MKLLLDTHVIIWSAGNPEKLSQKVRNLLIDTNNFWVISMASVWELQIKSQLGKLIGLGITLWEGKFEDRQDTWLRWCYQDGTVLLTGDERAEQEQQRAEQAEQRTQLLAERLRAMGIDPDTL